MEKFFSIFGKVVLIVLVLGIIGGGAYYFGTRSSVKTSQSLPTSLIPPSTNVQKSSPTVEISPVLSTTLKKTISAGNPQPPFNLYVLSYPSDWTPQHDSPSSGDKLTLTKSNYTLTISQAAGGGGGCAYGNEPPQEMTQQFDSYVEIKAQNNTFRRGTSQQTPTTFTVCENRNGQYGFPTTFGYITYNTPANPNTSMLTEMDSIVTSILKQH